MFVGVKQFTDIISREEAWAQRHIHGGA